jgi:predicted nucleic acid-binding protein
VTAFVDTSAIYAILDRDDENHSSADGIWVKLLDAGAGLVTTNYVAIEISALVQRRLGMPALRTFYEDISPLLTIEWIAPDQHKAGVQAVMAASRRKLSLVDCVSFNCARSHSIRDVFGFDSHFREQGFRLISARDL